MAIATMTSACGKSSSVEIENAETEKKEVTEVQMTVTSDILGLCDTGNKTSLKQELIYTSGSGDINLYHYCYGRTCTDLSLSTEFVENTIDLAYASGVKATDEIQWGWKTDNTASMEFGKPYLNDAYTDYFTVIWPEGTDASKITADDVKVILYSAFGDEYHLSVETVYGEKEFDVIANEDETVIAVTYQQWAASPVFSTMSITVDAGDLKASKDFEITSVSASTTQTGGGGVTVDHTVTVMNIHGVLGMTQENAANTEYTLSTEVDGKTLFYCEDENGKACLLEGTEVPGIFGSTIVAPEDAWKGDATEKYHIAVLGNCIFFEHREDVTQEKTVEGITHTFTENVSANRSISEMIERGAHLQDGYNLDGGVVTGQWAWTKRYQSGWTLYTSQPTGLPYIDGYYPYGFKAGSSNPAYDKEIADSANSSKPMSGMDGFGGPDGMNGDFEGPQ